MPVVFVVDPKLPKDVKTITLSYTFFELDGAEDGGEGRQRDLSAKRKTMAEADKPRR